MLKAIVAALALLFAVSTVDARPGPARANLTSTARHQQPTLPMYSRVVIWGDGVMSANGTPGMRGFPMWLVGEQKGQLMPPAGWMQAASGSDLDVVYGRLSYALASKPQLFVVASMGHNDTIYSASYATVMVKWSRNVREAVAGAPKDALIVISTTLTSNVGGESTYWPIVRGLQLTLIAQLRAQYGPRIVAFDTFQAYGGYGPWDYTTMTPAADGTHPNVLGGMTLSRMMSALIRPYQQIAPADSVVNTTHAQGWRGANIYTQTALSGTAGTNAATTVPSTGQVATSQQLTNNLTNGSGVTVTAAKVAQSGYDDQTIDVTGTAAVSNAVIYNRTANFSFGAGSTPGTYWMLIANLNLSNGASGGAANLSNWGMAIGNQGAWGGSTDLAASALTPLPVGLSFTPLVPMQPVAGADTVSSNPQLLQLRFNGSAAMDALATYNRPQIFQAEVLAYGFPVNISANGIVGSTFQSRATGTGVTGSGFGSAGSINSATVGTIRLDPGTFVGGGITFTKQAKKNGVVVSGAFASGWTYNAAGTLAGGDVFTIEVWGTNAFGVSAVTTLTFNVT